MSSLSALSPLAFASQQLVIYVGFFLFIAGIIGGPLVLLVFLSLRTFRQSSCAFYLTIMSAVNILHLFTGLLTFIMINGFAINWLNMSIVYCKLRYFYIQLCILISFGCMCLAVIDQFLATCSNPRWRQWNNIKLARYIIIGVVIVAILHGIPFLMYYKYIISPATGQISCAITNTIFQKYLSAVYGPFLINALPIVIMIIIGILAYRNIQQIAYRTIPLVRRELDKQLTTMVLVEVFSDLLAIVPNFIVSLYSFIMNAANGTVMAIELGYISNMATILYYWHFVSPFYIYVCVSKRFRQQLFHVLFTIHLNRWYPQRIINNQIQPQT